MTISGIEHFWCKIVRSSANCALAFTLVENLRCESKVTDFQAHAFGEEQVAELQISVDHAMGVQVLERVNDLLGVALDLELVEALATL